MSFFQRRYDLVARVPRTWCTKSVKIPSPFVTFVSFCSNPLCFASVKFAFRSSLNPKVQVPAISDVFTEEFTLHAGSVAEVAPRRILAEECERAQTSLLTLGIRFSVSHAELQWKGGRPKKPPYLCCCYNAGDLGNVNIKAFSVPLLGDWQLMERDVDRYQRRIHSAIREEMIHALQIITAQKKYDQSAWLKRRYPTAEIYYEHLLGAIIHELATRTEGKRAVLIAAQLYYEDWSITSMERLRETDRKLHGRDGYLAIELIRQLVQIRCGELTSEEARGSAWDKHRIFYVGKFGTTENLLKSMADTLRHSVPSLVTLSPTLAEALDEIEKVIQTIDAIRRTPCEAQERILL
jgi:hypothetical protein